LSTNPNFDPHGDTIDESQLSSNADGVDSERLPRFDSAARTLDSTAGGVSPAANAFRDDDDFESSVRDLGADASRPPVFDSSARTLDPSAVKAFDSAGPTLDSAAATPTETESSRDRSTESLLQDNAFREHATIAEGIAESNPSIPAKQEQSSVQSAFDDTLVDNNAASGIVQSIGTRRVKRLKLPSRDSDLPERVGNYAPVRELGRGGMGVVYEAVNLRTDRKAALKVLITPGGSASEVAVARFHVEARAAGRLKHKNIVEVLDQDQDPETGQQFLAMALVEGETLWDKVRRDGALDEARGVEVFLELADALTHAHGEKVLHRDLKPQNVILDALNKDRPMITDFGLAKLQGEDLNLTQDGPTLIGTPGFMPPEQAGTGIPIDHRADIYSLAATLYFALTGKPPFKAPSLPAVLNLVVHEAPQAPSQIISGFSHDLETIVLKCLLKRPDDRYSSASELKDDLLRFQAKEAIEARRLPPLVRFARWAQGNVLTAATLALTVVALLGAAAFSAIVARRHDEGVTKVTKLQENVKQQQQKFEEKDREVTQREEEVAAKIEEIEKLPPTLEIQAPADSSQPDTEPALTAKRAIDVRLWVPDDDLATLTLNGAAVPTAESKGYFETSWVLEQEGKNVAELVATDTNGNQTETTLVVVRDTTPPEFTVTLENVLEHSGDPEAFAAVQVAIKLTSTETTPATASVAAAHSATGSRALPLVETSAGVWECTVDLSLGPNTLAIQVTDALGNTSSPRERVVERVSRRVLRGASWELAAAQRAYALEADLPVIIDGGMGIMFVLIPPGTFVMGCPEDEVGHQPNEDQHPVELSRGYYLSATEVTNAQFRQIFEGDPSFDGHRPSPATGKYTYPRSKRGQPWEVAVDSDELPVVNVLWEQAEDFCRRLGQKMGSTRYRLPSEAEWEYACRAGTQSRWFWGDDPKAAAGFANVAGDQARDMLNLGVERERGHSWFPFDDEAFPLVAPVRSFEPNAFGLFDMIGNASEWCADFLAEYRIDRDDAGVARRALNPKGPETGTRNARVFRGGSWRSRLPQTRAAYRSGRGNWKSRTLGFRVVMEIVH
jgi:formylglycine-generating enzyme required for sulfatase activity